MGRSIESVDSKFFEDNKNWIMDEVKNYLEGAVDKNSENVEEENLIDQESNFKDEYMQEESN